MSWGWGSFPFFQRKSGKSPARLPSLRSARGGEQLRSRESVCSRFAGSSAKQDARRGVPKLGFSCSMVDVSGIQPAPKYHTKGCSHSSADSPGARTLVFAAFEPFHSCEFRASIARTPFCAILWRSPRYFLFFSARGRGRGVRGAEGDFLLKIPGGGGSPGRVGEGGARDREGVCGKLGGGGGAKYFLSGPKFPARFSLQSGELCGIVTTQLH